MIRNSFSGYHLESLAKFSHCFYIVAQLNKMFTTSFLSKISVLLFLEDMKVSRVEFPVGMDSFKQHCLNYSCFGIRKSLVILPLFFWAVAAAFIYMHGLWIIVFPIKSFAVLEQASILRTSILFSSETSQLLWEVYTQHFWGIDHTSCMSLTSVIHLWTGQSYITDSNFWYISLWRKSLVV